MKAWLGLVFCFALASAELALPQPHRTWAYDSHKGPELDKPVIDQGLIDRINADPTSPWKARRNARFEGVSRRDAYSLVAKEKPQHRPPVAQQAAKPLSVPAEFDSRKAWPGCVHSVLDQGDCGSCYAFGSSQAFSDRFCVQSNGTINVQLSPQPLISCDWWADFGCNGGLLQTTWWWLEDYGLPKLSCDPYQSGDGKVPSCRSTCQDGEQYVAYKAKLGTTTTHIGVASIQQAILSGGPVEASFAVFDDFYDYDSGVYVRKSLNFVGFHAVKMLGWGHDNSTNLDYWLLQNSWGPSWGEKGFFKLLRGQDECFIETDVVAADVQLP